MDHAERAAGGGQPRIPDGRARARGATPARRRRRRTICCSATGWRFRRCVQRPPAACRWGSRWTCIRSGCWARRAASGARAPGPGRRAEPDLPGASPARPVPGSRQGGAAAAGLAGSRWRPEDDRPAGRLPRRQLLRAGVPARRGPRRPAPRREEAKRRQPAGRGRVRAGGPGAHADGLAGRSRGPLRAADRPVQGRARPAAVHHRERPRRGGLRQPGRPGQRRRAGPVPAPAPGGRGPGDQGRGEPGRLLPLVSAGQLRVGLGVPEAVRHRVRRLRHAAADPQIKPRFYSDVARANAVPALPPAACCAPTAWPAPDYRARSSVDLYFDQLPRRVQ